MISNLKVEILELVDIIGLTKEEGFQALARLAKKF